MTTRRLVGLVICYFLVSPHSLALGSEAARAKPAPKSRAERAEPRAPARPAAAGIYADEEGGRHAWRVSPGHALVWDDRPYMPVGTLFRAASLGDASEAAWERDRAALDEFRARGVLDLIVRADRGLLTAPSGALTRLVGALRDGGFRYGLDINDRPSSPLHGFWLRPIALDVGAEKLAPGASSRWSVPIPDAGAEAVLWALVEGRDGAAVRAGRVAVKEGKAEIEVTFRPGRRLFPSGAGQLLVLPIRRMPPDEGDGAPDLWASLPGYRDRLVRALREVPWGPGLRFFLEPVVVGANLRGDLQELLPSSELFRLELEAWLQRKGGVGDVSVSWGLSDRRVDSLSIAARLVPMWRPEEGPTGVGWFVDPETFDLYRVDRRRSTYWDDMERFRGDSARRAMNLTADLLKQRVAEVPVLYRWSHLHPAFSNRETVDGWDGLVVDDMGTKVPTSPSHTLAAAMAYAQCEGSERTLWFMAHGVRPRAEGMRLLQMVGARGYYVDEGSTEAGDEVAAAAPPPVAPSHPRTLAPSPPSDDPVEQKPAALFYPAGKAPGVNVTRLANGVWWLPSFATGKSLVLGDGMEGYQIDLPFADQPPPTSVVWSTAGAQKSTFFVPRELDVAVFDSMGMPVKAKLKKGRMQLELGEAPYVLAGLKSEAVFPVEAAAHALAELEALLKLAEARKLNPNVLTALKAAVADAKAVFTERTAATAFDLIRGPLESLRAYLSPYLWIEGERPRDHTFSGVAPEPAASQGAFLSLGTSRAPAGGTYAARYTVTVNTGGLYDLWLAGSAPGEEGASALTWDVMPLRDGQRAEDRERPSINTQPLRFGPGPQKPYAPGLRWSRLGSVRLEAGRYLLSLSVPKSDTERYDFRVDALLFAREPFIPQGTRQPSWRLAERR